MEINVCGRCGKNVDLEYDRCLSCNARWDFIPYRTVEVAQPTRPNVDREYTPTVVATPAGDVEIPRCFLVDGTPVFGALPGHGVVYGWPAESDGLILRYDGATGVHDGTISFKEPPEVYTAAKGWSAYRDLARS